jgi:hypothetical protein
MKFCHSQVNDATREHHFKQRRPKIACSPSHVDYRSKTNAVISLVMGQTLRGEYTQEKLGQERKPKT